LQALEDWTEARRAHAHYYRESLGQVGVEVVGERRGDRHVYHIFAIRTDQRAELAAALAAEGVATGIHYPVPVHLQEAYREIANGPGSFPVSEQAANEVLSLPIYPELTAEQRNRIVDLVARVGTKSAAA
jgi:dTDP-4-amino-4,6-dideoxygalactose transaminase